eukprot:Sspe_Gene.104110::Locus_79995_Transcript_1_1_Confidence_1.000_Length_1407::g.104110::m.104110/K11415/SIRT5, SIR2L5; NAD-dependent deacetylase sirtuin 5
MATQLGCRGEGERLRKANGSVRKREGERPRVDCYYLLALKAMPPNEKPQEEVISAFQEKLRASRKVTILTGAGVSAESGIPTFRGEGGLWRKYNAMDLVTPEAFEKDPALVWQFHHNRREVAGRCLPNPGHFALAELEERLVGEGKDFTLLTQNVDGLHQAAGSKKVVEMHGSLWRLKEFSERRFAEGYSWEDRTMPLAPALDGVCGSDFDTEGKDIPVSDLPHKDGVLLRPAVVWFGEDLDPDTRADCRRALANCDLLMVIGTSSTVLPASSFAFEVRMLGGAVAEFNLEPSTESDYCILGPSGRTLPKALDY